MRKSGFTLIELMSASVVLAVLAAIAIPSFTRSQVRMKESEVKTAAHALQMAVEDYKAHYGWEKPDNAAPLVWVCQNWLPLYIRIKGNPFNTTSPFIRGGPPQYIGEIGYEFSTRNDPYTITCMGGTQGVIILTLVEGQ